MSKLSETMLVMWRLTNNAKPKKLVEVEDE